MNGAFYPHMIHGADYNPDQWIGEPGIWDEDMRLMDLSHMNSATVGIFSWSRLEPAEGVYDFTWLDEIMDRLAAHGKRVVLATPSGARPAWLAQKYPEVLRVEESGLRNEYGVRHNHCLTSPVYREKVREIDRRLAERYRDHPALFMWHISNEYSGECHCELCQKAFQDWLRREYDNDLDLLNKKWWNGFWSHIVTDWSQIRSPKYRGENHVPALKLAWRRFVTDQQISFFENEIGPLRELTPDVPITTNFMRLYDGIDYQRFASHVDLISWDNYPEWTNGDNAAPACETAFVHDVFRSMKDGQPFYMMESTPSQINWRPVNRLPRTGVHELEAIQAAAHGADSVQYFQWRKSRGGHEKFHGAVVDHYGKEDTRVFREVTKVGEVLERLDGVVGERTNARAAVIYDWENGWALRFFSGYREDRDYAGHCVDWYRALWERGIAADVISEEQALSRYDLVIAPTLYLIKDGAAERIAEYVKNGGTFVGTCLTGLADRDDLCFLGGFPGGVLKDVFGVWCEETDALGDGESVPVSYNGKSYAATEICDILHLRTAEALGEYDGEFYAGTPAVTENRYGKGAAYYVAFRADGALIRDLCGALIEKTGLTPDLDAALPTGVSARRRGDLTFVMNFSDRDREIACETAHRDLLTGESVRVFTLPPCGYRILV